LQPKKIKLSEFKKAMNFLKKITVSKRKKSDLMLSLDIGTEWVKVVLFKIDDEKQKGVVIGQGQVRQRLGSMTSGAVSDIKSVIATCREAIAQAEEQAKVQKVKKVIMGIAGELVKGTTTTVHYERANPEIRIDLPELRNILQKVQWKAFDRIKKQLAWETGQETIDVRLINAAIVSVKIDGYRITNPMGFQGRDVSISIFNAYAPMIHLGALQRIADELGLEVVSIAAEPYAIAQSIGVYGDPDFGAVIIDIGGGTTDVAVIRNGGLEGTVMFALGGRAFTKRLAKSFGVSFNEAEQIKIQYATEGIRADWAVKIDKIFKEDCSVWLSGLEIAFESFRSQEALPSRILLCGGGSGLPIIRKTLLNGQWKEDLPISNSLQVSYLQPRDIVNVIDQTGQLITPQSVAALGLASLAVNMKFDDDEIVNDVLRKAVKIIQD
jgi:cell division protein FtsA